MFRNNSADSKGDSGGRVKRLKPRPEVSRFMGRARRESDAS